MSALIYVEMSVLSFYYETCPETQLQALREWTREWWDVARVRDGLVTAAAVVLKLWQAPELKRTEALALIEPVPLLEDLEEVDEIVAVYFRHRLMPRDAEGDARRLAVATFHECDLATWNCRHIADVNKQEHICAVNSSISYAKPLVATPYVLLERSS